MSPREAHLSEESSQLGPVPRASPHPESVHPRSTEVPVFVSHNSNPSQGEVSSKMFPGLFGGLGKHIYVRNPQNFMTYIKSCVIFKNFKGAATTVTTNKTENSGGAADSPSPAGWTAHVRV